MPVGKDNACESRTDSRPGTNIYHPIPPLEVGVTDASRRLFDVVVVWALDRPRAVFNRARILELRAQGKSWRAIAGTLGVGIATVHRAFQTGVPKPIAGARGQ